MSVSYYVCIGEGVFVPRDKMYEFHDDFPEIYESEEGANYIIDTDPICCRKDYFVGVTKRYEIKYDEFPTMVLADVQYVNSPKELFEFNKWFSTIEDKLNLKFEDCRVYLFSMAS